ncbi:MAG: HD domain-containing protein [Woeseiaceae bacterium]
MAHSYYSIGKSLAKSLALSGIGRKESSAGIAIPKRRRSKGKVMDDQLWRGLTKNLSIDTNLETFEKLQSAYSEKHRHYHTGVHIDYCLALFDEYRTTAIAPAEVECALWFHDAVYNPMSGDNELKSANWAVRFLRKNGCSDEQCNLVRHLIMSTIHEAPAIDPDAQLLVDIDLAILGTNEKTYERFEIDVRREYKWVPGPLFRRARMKILQSFLDRDSIYSTRPFRDKYESRARSNIEETLKRL